MLPLLDFGLAVFRRMRAGKSPFAPDRKHLHHRMLDLGHRDRDAVLVFYSWTAVISLAVLLMYIGTRQDWPGGYIPGIVFGVVGAAACLVVTRLPSHNASSADAPHAAEGHDDAPVVLPQATEAPTPTKPLEP
jgi:UDP-GlcNAc:undecaprenyl-phosphate GlcNAc-1-phosphate transferase